MMPLFSTALAALALLGDAHQSPVRRHGRPRTEGDSSSLQTSSRSFTSLTQLYPFYHSSEELQAEARRVTAGCEASLRSVAQGNVSIDVARVKATREPLNKVFILFGEHSRELIGPETGLALLRALCRPDRSKLAEEVLQETEFELVLNGNPRSRRLVESGDFCIRTNPSGVDLNRNWDEEWQQESAVFGKDSNPGPSPFSEPETRIFKSLVSDFKPTTFLTVHSGTLGLYMPWAYDKEHLATRNQKAMMEVLQQLDTSHCQCPFGAAGREVGYNCPGTCLDWIYDKLETPFAFAFEIYVDEERIQELQDRWRRAPKPSRHLATSEFFKVHPSDFIQLSGQDSGELERNCFAAYNPASEERYNSTVENWVTAYLEMAQKVSEHLRSK